LHSDLRKAIFIRKKNICLGKHHFSERSNTRSVQNLQTKNQHKRRIPTLTL
jgi:hypothetical protein